MSIFGRDEQSRPSAPSTTSPSPSPSATPSSATPSPRTESRSSGGTTQISAGTRIEGEITGSTDVVIDGSLDGRVNVESLVSVGRSGQVRGEIRARSVVVAGKVFGNIVGADKVDIHSSGKLEGDVKAPRVSIAEGAYFKGRVEMTGEPARKPEAAASAKGDSTRLASKPPIRPATAPSLDAPTASESAK